MTGSSPVGISNRRPFLSYSLRTFSNSIATSLPFSSMYLLGTWKFRMGMSSFFASSISHGEAFISSKPLLTTTVTSLPPIRLDVRQQSIAVLPPPRTNTRFPIDETCSNATLASHSMPVWIWSLASSRPGKSSCLPNGAPVPTNMASKSSCSNVFMLVISSPNRELMPISRM